MPKLEIIYKIVDKNSKNPNIDNIPGYIFEVEEDLKELTEEKIKEFLIRDGMDNKYINKSIIEYNLVKEDENNKKNFKILEQNSIILEQNSEYYLYLLIKIDVNDYLEKEKENKNNKKEEEKKKNKELLSKINQIDKEIIESQKRIKKFRNSDIYYEAIRKIKNSLYFKSVKNIMEEEYKNDIRTEIFKKDSNKIKNLSTGKKMPGTDIFQSNLEEVSGKNNCKIFFLYSSPLKSDKNELCVEDYSYNKQWFKIYKIFKEKNKEKNIYLRQIDETLDFSYNDDIILHIRTDSIYNKEKQKIYFIKCIKNQISGEYELNDFIKFHNLLEKKNFKLLIISSNNIDEIKNEMDTKLKNVKKIYIYHPNKYNNKNEKEFEEKLILENIENKFVNDFYEYLIQDHNKNGKKDFIFDEYKDIIKGNPHFNKEELSFRTTHLNTNVESKTLKKYILNYDSIKNYYYPLIGVNINATQEQYQKKIFAHCINILSAKDEISICLYGEIGVGKRCFAKNLGISLFERSLFDKIIFLDIYSSEINYSKVQDKINIIKREISKNYKSDTKVLLIIYFNDVIEEENLSILLNELKRQRDPRNLVKKCLFVFTLNKEALKIFELKSKELSTTFKLTDENLQDKNEINEIKDLYNSFFNYNLNREIKNFDFDRLQNIYNNKNKIKISNIYLLFTYMNIFPEKNDKDFDLDKKKDIIKMIIDNKSEIYEDILVTLSIMKYGAGLNFLKLLWENSWEKKYKCIKEELFGLIFIEYKDEEIIHLDNSIREIIIQLGYNDLFEKIIKNILETYYIILRKKISEIEYSKILTFNACIKNSFWFNGEIKENRNFNGEYIFYDEIDSNNIYYIFEKFNKFIKNDEKLLPYIGDISITLPTLLHNRSNYIYEDLMLKFFEEQLLVNIYQIYKNKGNKEKILDIKKYIVRLGIFKSWASEIFDFSEKALKNAKININDYNEGLEEIKIEYYLIELYKHFIKKNKNIKELKKKCLSEIEKIDGDKSKKYNFEIRCKALCARCLNSIEEIKGLDSYDDYNGYKNELNSFITEYSSKNKLYFYFINPLKYQKWQEFYEKKAEINNHFYLTQKLKKILPYNFQVEFQTIKSEQEKIEIADKKYIKFLFLGNKYLYDNYLKNNKIRIKLLILGYLDKNIENNIKKIDKSRIKNIIYISNYDYNIKRISLLCIFEKLFYKFIHDFISLLFLKNNNNITIYDAFKEAKANFNWSMGSVLQNYKRDMKNIPEIKINMEDEDDTFELEKAEDENIEENNKEKINYFEDEIDYEDEKSKEKNVYYMENPFSKIEEKEEKKDIEIKRNKKYIKLPGIDEMNNNSMKEFFNGDIYKKSQFKDLVDFIEEKIKIKIKVLPISVKSKTLDGNFNFKLGEDLCKYFYMEKKFEGGIFLVKSIFDKEKLKKFLESENIIKNDLKKLVLFDNLNDIFDDNIINKMNQINNSLFIICSYNKDIWLNMKDICYQFFYDDDLIKDNEEYKIIQLI